MPQLSAMESAMPQLSAMPSAMPQLSETHFEQLCKKGPVVPSKLKCVRLVNTRYQASSPAGPSEQQCSGHWDRSCMAICMQQSPS
jgi:hypothetical protein